MNFYAEVLGRRVTFIGIQEQVQPYTTSNYYGVPVIGERSHLFFLTNIDHVWYNLKHGRFETNLNKFIEHWLGYEPEETIYHARGGVYMIGEVYIGQSKNIKKRLKRHVRDCLRLEHRNEALQEYFWSVLLGEAEDDGLVTSLSSEDIYDERMYFDIATQHQKLNLFNVGKCIGKPLK